MKKEKIAVSACLVGINCKYNGKNNYNEKVMEYLKDKEWISICPECYGGLSTPRIPSEIEEGKDGIDVVKNEIIDGKIRKTKSGEERKAKVFSKEGKDVTEEFINGAVQSLEKLKANGVKKAILKESSPSCGVNTIYNGKFNGTKKEGCGVSTALFRTEGIEVISEKNIR